jgi:ferric-dicitrate binding protein FerR (iron transport regulator)
MNPRDRVGLQHLADPLNSAIRFAQGRERGDLDSDEMQLFALVRAIEVAGEAASQVTAETRAQQPEEQCPRARAVDAAGRPRPHARRAAQGRLAGACCYAACVICG